ncbi:hypothetical protein Tco_1443753 [Tanacetum coccineum]
MDVEIHRPPFGVDSELGRGLILGDCIRTIVAPLLDYMVHGEQIHLLGASSPLSELLKLTGNEETTNYQRFIACVAQGMETPVCVSTSCWIFVIDTMERLRNSATGTDNQEKDEKQSQNNKTGLGMEKTVKDKVVWEVIETGLAVEAERRFATRRFTTSSSLFMLSANLAKDSWMVGGVDVGGVE